MSDSLQPHELYHLWNSPSQNTGVGNISLLQGSFLTQESNGGLLHWRWILYQLSYQEDLFNIGRTDAESETPWTEWTPCLATWCEELTHWKRSWCWERLKAKGEGDDRGWDGWMVSPTQWIWVWVGSWSWWWTGKPGIMQSMGPKGSDMTEWLNWTECHRQVGGLLLRLRWLT